MDAQDKSGLWTILTILVVTVAILVVIATLAHYNVWS